MCEICCSKLRIKTLEKFVNFFKVNNKDTITICEFVKSYKKEPRTIYKVIY